MRTLVVIHSLKMGGMERVAVNLADAFAEQGHDSHLLSCRNHPNDLQPGDERVTLHHWDQFRSLLRSIIGIPVFLLSRLVLGVALPRSHFIWVGWLQGWLLKRHIARLEKRHGRFDRIIFRGLGTFKYFWSFRDDRCVYVLENIIHYDRPLWQKIWEWKLVFHGRHLACVSTGVEDSARQAFAKGHVEPKSLRVITNPCPVEQIRELASQDNPDIPAVPYIINVARLVPQKGQALLLDSFARATIPHQLVIVGEGPLENTLRQKVEELGIEDRVLLAGKQTNPYPWMKRADLFVLASEYEGLGIVLTEALACGTLPVSVDSPGVRQVFRDELGQYLVPRDMNSLSSKLEEVLSSPLPEVDPDWLEPYRSETITRLFLEDPEQHPFRG